MKNLKFKALLTNLLLAVLIVTGMNHAMGAELPVIEAAGAITATSTAFQYIMPSIGKGFAFMALQTEVWVAGIKEQPIPDHSFVNASMDMSEYVEHNTLHLAEAGVDPQVFEDYFDGNEDPLPIQDVADTPSEVVLKTVSTAQTRHRELQEIELQYNRRQSVIQRHRNAIHKHLAKSAAQAWAPDQNNAFNKVITLGNDSIIDALIDMEQFFNEMDMLGDPLNVCLMPAHMAKIRKEDIRLYKALKNEKGVDLYGFTVYGYTKNPIYTSAGVKKPLGSVLDAGAGDLQSSFFWSSNEVFRCFGDVKAYLNEKDSGIQADTLSYAQRALLGKIRANAPKYSGAII